MFINLILQNTALRNKINLFINFKKLIVLYNNIINFWNERERVSVKEFFFFIDKKIFYLLNYLIFNI